MSCFLVFVCNEHLAEQVYSGCPPPPSQRQMLPVSKCHYQSLYCCLVPYLSEYTLLNNSQTAADDLDAN